MQSHCSTCVIFFFICEINEIPQTLQKTESANGGKTRLTMGFIGLKCAEKLEKNEKSRQRSLLNITDERVVKTTAASVVVDQDTVSGQRILVQ